MKILGIMVMVLLVWGVEALALYDQPYIEYDDDGITQINCVRCNVAVLERALVPRQKQGVGEVYVYIYKRFSHIEEMPLDLSNGSYTNLYFCRDCKREYQCTDEELLGMTAQFRLGFELEAKAVKKSDKYIEKVKKRYEGIKVKKIHTNKKRDVKRGVK